jgi:uncharacterized membrane protein required for colicin V production
MTWVDIFLVLLIFFFGFGGYQRGLVRELFDLVILGLGLGVALRFFVPVGEALQLWSGASGPNCKMVAFLVLFLLVAVLVLALGLHLDQMHAEDSSVPRPLKFGLGAVLGALKGLFMAWLFLLALHHLPLVDHPTRMALHTAPVAQSVQGLQPTFVALGRALIPRDTAVWLIPELERRF